MTTDHKKIDLLKVQVNVMQDMIKRCQKAGNLEIEAACAFDIGRAKMQILEIEDRIRQTEEAKKEHEAEMKKILANSKKK